LSDLSESIVPKTTMLKQIKAGRFIRNKIKKAAKPVVLKPIEKIIETEKPVIPKEKKPDKIDIDNYIFQSEFEKKKTNDKKAGETRKKPKYLADPVKKDSVPAIAKDTSKNEFMLPSQRNYDPAFTADYFVTQLDNSLENATYQAFT
jgi:hypothetical protein